MKRIAALSLLLAACSGGETRQQTNDNSPAGGSEVIPDTDTEPPVPVPGNVEAPAARPAPATPPTSDQKSPEAAAAVLRDYFQLIEQKKYADAHRLWSASSADDDLSDGAFTASFENYRSYHAVVGTAGQMEGAAGSSYIDFPVTVTGELKDGRPFRLVGPVTLRRVNDVPGATPEQLQWRIMRSALKPRP